MPDEEHEIRNRVIQFVEEELNPISLQVEASGEIPPEIVEKMRAVGVFGMSIRRSLWWLGLSTLEEVMVYEETHPNQRLLSLAHRHQQRHRFHGNPV